ncbi:MAG: diadenylate cyclase CdaA [Oscillospiraceae bacterium]|nr:diadenylate cyclase CdaA [Oscillospiraceae bacterium]
MEAIRDWVLSTWRQLTLLAQAINPWDVIDILIVAYLVYRILTLMRKTSSGSVIKGIILLLAVAWLSYMFNLRVVSYLLDQVFAMGIIILIVLFQPEVRKLFEQVGSSKLRFLFRKNVKLEDIEAGIHAVVSATVAMAKSRTGAIIVFEREVGINDYAVTGIEIDAKITSDLIQSVFYRDSPLHDGALLIRDWRLLAASCMLPLSTNINLSRDLGMRHKAGIGISERSDALVVIVSEQSGTIAVAVDGMLKRHLAQDTFEKLLVNELMHKPVVGTKQKNTVKSKG